MKKKKRKKTDQNLNRSEKYTNYFFVCSSFHRRMKLYENF